MSNGPRPRPVKRRYNTITREEAQRRGLRGSNIRCNRCGDYGAEWVKGQRPGWGALALCPEHARDLRAELERHRLAMDWLRAVNFEQEQ